MNKKVVVFGGGRALPVLLRGLKLFPVDITVIVNVSDDGGSTGKLREEFGMPAMGDIRGVMTSLSASEPMAKKLLEYRFETTGNLNDHSLGNLIITAATNITGNLTEALASLSDFFNLSGTILPVTNESVTLVAKMTDGTTIEGEHKISEAGKTIAGIWYKEEPTTTPEVLKAIKNADLIIFGIGSLYTSIIPNILGSDVRQAVLKSNARKMYVCNAMTQSGETSGFKVSDCIKVLNHYMGKDFLDVVIAADTKIPQKIIDRYKGLEMKSTILIDQTEIDAEAGEMNPELITDDLLLINKKGFVEHDPLKTGFAIFSYLMKKK